MITFCFLFLMSQKSFLDTEVFLVQWQGGSLGPGGTSSPPPFYPWQTLSVLWLTLFSVWLTFCVMQPTLCAVQQTSPCQKLMFWFEGKKYAEKLFITFRGWSEPKVLKITVLFFKPFPKHQRITTHIIRQYIHTVHKIKPYSSFFAA